MFHITEVGDKSTFVCFRESLKVIEHQCNCICTHLNLQAMHCGHILYTCSCIVLSPVQESSPIDEPFTPDALVLSINQGLYPYEY